MSYGTWKLCIVFVVPRRHFSCNPPRPPLFNYGVSILMRESHVTCMTGIRRRPEKTLHCSVAAGCSLLLNVCNLWRALGTKYCCYMRLTGQPQPFAMHFQYVASLTSFSLFVWSRYKTTLMLMERKCPKLAFSCLMSCSFDELLKYLQEVNRNKIINIKYIN